MRYWILLVFLMMSPVLALKAAADESPQALTACKQDSDCIVVPYHHCCGSTKRAINKDALSDYNAHPEWQTFDGPQCATMGACVPDDKVKEAHCAQGACTLTY